MVALKKPKTFSQHSVKLKCLASLPKFDLETCLAPYMPHVNSLSKALENTTALLDNLQAQNQELAANLQYREEHIVELKSQIKLAQNTLDRRSVKFVLWLVHRLLNAAGRKKQDTT